VLTVALRTAREACARARWDVAYEQFGVAAEDGELDLDDLAAQADAAWWLGKTDESLTLSETVYRRSLQEGAGPTAARLAIEIGFLWMLRGEATIGSGWMRRAARLLETTSECAAHGYLLHLEVLEALGAGRFEAAVAGARHIRALAERCDDPTLEALALGLEGVATVKAGEVEVGLVTLDEAMLPVRAGSVAPNWAGNLYCHLMGLFLELADVPRARAWTDATERWCDQHSNAAMFTGICRVHRAQLLNLEGAWADAEQRAAQACRDLADMNVGVVAAGHYEIGELRRVRGDRAGAEQAYARAQELGRDPQPGLARLRLAQGRLAAADAALRTTLTATEQALQRAPLLAARVDVAEAAADAGTALACATELTSIAATYRTPGLEAMAEQATGTACLAAGDPHGALGRLRAACLQWHQLGARYEAARTRVRLARALGSAGDRDAAAREIDAARGVLTELGARDDLAALNATAGRRDRPGGLSAREIEVLRLVAAGASNRAIAQELTISVRTVERHIANIFVKVGAASRTEAARFAYLHGLAEDTERG
jgi:DNA-binding CsgD family transcriptional regulator